MAKRKKGYRRVYDEGTGKTKLGRRKEVDVYRPLTGVGKTLVKDITYKSDDSPRVKYTEREVTRRNKDGSVKSYKNIIRKNGKIVDEVTTKKIKYKDGGPKVKQRRGSRKNYDNKAWTPSGLQFPTSESSHLMMAEYDDDINPSTGKPVGWVGFPSLFQDDKPYANDQDNWVQMSGDNGWGSIYEEAKRRGEVYYFGEDKEAALAFGEGSWKDQLPDEVMEVELTDEEVEQYKAGGYVLEEMHEGGEPGHTHDEDPPDKRIITDKAEYDKLLGEYNANLRAYEDYIKFRDAINVKSYHPEYGDKVLSPLQRINRGVSEKRPEELEYVPTSPYEEITMYSREYDPRMVGWEKYYDNDTYTVKPEYKERFEGVDSRNYQDTYTQKQPWSIFKYPKPELDFEYMDPTPVRLPVLEPELLETEKVSIPELEERDEVEGIDYERKFGVWSEDKAQKDAKLKTFFKYKVPEFFNDKPSRTSQYYRTPKRLRAGFYNKPIENELEYPEGFVPKFYKEGGYMEDNGGTYTVKSGDTFNAIAYANGISPTELAAANPKVKRDKLSIGQVLNIPEAAKVEEKTTEKEKVKKDIVIDLEGLKKGIAHVESADGTLMMNPTSSATGLYGQLYNEVKDLPELKGVTREQFAKDIDLQNKIFDKRFYEGLPGVPSLQSNALDLYEEYSPQLENFDYSYEDIATLSNFLGRQGTREFFASIRDSKKFTPPGINKTPGQYLEGARPSYIKEEQDGGFIEMDLSEDELKAYVDGGYILEELPSYEPGGANDSDNPLADWANQQATLWSNLYETDPQGRALATSYFSNIGDNYNLGLIQKGKMPHWSAATVSNAVMANIGATDKETSQILGFNPTASHSGYVRDAFKTSNNPNYKYNRYVAEGMGDSEYGIGDILVKGRSGTKNWKYGDFKKATDSYESHGDIIVDRGEDDKGKYVILAGGNLGDTYKNKKVYESTLKSDYTVKLTDAKRGQRLYGSSQKSDNLGQDVTVNKKGSSPFANNFDWDIDNDQTTEDVNQDPFPISSFDNSSKLVASNNNALFGADTLGIGYIPYQYQFPDYLGRPKDEDDVIIDEDVSISNSINQNEIDKADNTDKDKTNVILSDDIELTEDQILTNKAKEMQKLGPLSAFSIDKLKELVSPENATKLTSDNPTVKNELNLLKKSGEARDKRLEKGDVWISYNDPEPYIQTKGWIEAQKSKFWTDPVTGEKKKIGRHNPYSIVGSMMDNASDRKMIKELGEFYGDGSDKYGEWITAEEVAKMENASAVQNAWRDNPNMQNSGRTEDLIPSLVGGLFEGAMWRYNPLSMMGWTAGSEVVNRAIESEEGGPPLTGSIFADIKNRPEVYQEVPQTTSKGFIESLPDIGNNISNWPLVKDIKYWWDNFEDGGSIPKARDGRVVSEIWKDVTGTPWSQAKAQGLTDGSYSQNIALRNKLLSGELGEVTPAKSSSSFDYNAYDANVKRLVDKGYSLDDLVKTRMGTMSGLTSRFPDLFSNASKAEEPKKESYQTEEVVDQPKAVENEELEEVVIDPAVILNPVSDEELGKWAMTAKLPAKLQSKVDKIKNSPMGKAGDLDYARIVNDLGRDALLKNYTPSNVEVEEKETIVEPDVKEDKPNILSLIKSADWAPFGNAVLDKLSSKAEPLLSVLYDAGSNVSDYFKDRVETLELEALEAENLRRQGYTVEEVEEPAKASFDDWYANKLKEVAGYEQPVNNTTFKPIMANHPANAFRNQPDKGGMLYDGPLTPLEKFTDEAGKYVDAAVGLPKKIYEGASKEITGAIEKLQKTSILPANIVKDIKTAANTAEDVYNTSADLITSIYNEDKEGFLENKYGQEIALKILDQYDNPDKYYNLKFMNLNDDEVNFLRRKLEKEGRINTPEAIVKPVKERIVEVKPKPETFTEDAVDENGKVIKAIDKGYSNNPLYTYRNQWDNNVGFVYKTAPTKQHRRYSDEYTDVKGVAHFLLDASVDPKNPFSHKNNIAYIKKAKANNDWIPTFTKYSDDMVLLKYKKPADILETDIVNTPLRQLKFSDINFKSNQTPRGFKKTVREVTTKDGDGTYLLFKNKDAISRFSGGSVVFIFEDEYGNAIVRDFAGSINAIQSEGNSITKQYNLEPGELTIGYHDVGSFSAKPKANKNNVLKASQWSDYNDNGWTGGALLIPTTNVLNEASTKYDKEMSRMFPNTYNK
jgi:murein DD-endopeptidase MepM/ murein hydrolase activator NlpD